MTAASQQIITCYEELGMSIDEIAAAGHGDPVAIKAVLLQWSQKYREEMKVNKAIDFTEEDHDQVLAVIRNAALFAEDEHLRFRAAKYIRDDKKGRLDLNKGLKNLNISLQTFTLHLERANSITSRRSRSAQTREQITDVEAELKPAWSNRSIIKL